MAELVNLQGEQTCPEYLPKGGLAVITPMTITRAPGIEGRVADMVATADAALYLAKTQGRNRTQSTTQIAQSIEK